MNEVPNCSVCMEELFCDLACSPCGHVFHIVCAKACIKNKLKCPLCRQRMPLNKLLSISYEITNTTRSYKTLEERKQEISRDTVDFLNEQHASANTELKVLQKKTVDNSIEIANLKAFNFGINAKLQEIKLERQEIQEQYDNLCKIHTDFRSSVPMLENLSIVLKELEQSKTIVPWISNTIEQFSPSDQIIHYHSALFLITNTLESWKQKSNQFEQQAMNFKAQVYDLLSRKNKPSFVPFGESWPGKRIPALLDNSHNEVLIKYRKA